MGGYKGIKADGGKVDQAKQLAAKQLKILKHVKSKRNSSLSISKVVIGKDSSPIQKDVLLIMAKFQEELVQPMADHQKQLIT